MRLVGDGALPPSHSLANRPEREKETLRARIKAGSRAIDAALNAAHSFRLAAAGAAAWRLSGEDHCAPPPPAAEGREQISIENVTPVDQKRGAEGRGEKKDAKKTGAEEVKNASLAPDEREVGFAPLPENERGGRKPPQSAQGGSVADGVPKGSASGPDVGPTDGLAAASPGAFERRRSEWLAATERILRLAPDWAPLWAFRRRLGAARGPRRPAEAALLADLLRGNGAKSYAVWEARRLLFLGSEEGAPEPGAPDSGLLFTAEIDLVQSVILTSAADRRNFHAWTYLMQLCRGAPSLMHDFARRVVEIDMDNYSAWHFYAETAGTAHEARKQLPPFELSTDWLATSAIFTAPESEGVWQFWEAALRRLGVRRVTAGPAPLYLTAAGPKKKPHGETLRRGVVGTSLQCPFDTLLYFARPVRMDSGHPCRITFVGDTVRVRQSEVACAFVHLVHSDQARMHSEIAGAQTGRAANELRAALALLRELRGAVRSERAKENVSALIVTALEGLMRQAAPLEPPDRSLAAECLKDLTGAGEGRPPPLPWAVRQRLFEIELRVSSGNCEVRAEDLRFALNYASGGWHFWSSIVRC